MRQGLRAGVMVFLFSLFPLTSAQGATLTGSSTTMPMLYQKTIGGEEIIQAPVYEYLRLSLSDIGLDGLSLHLSGWAKAELHDYLPGDSKNGDLNYGYLDWHMGKRALQIRAGRQLVYMGVASRQTDGVTVRFEKYNLGVGIVSGSPVTGPGESSDGSYLTGGQLYYTLNLRKDLGGEIAISYLSLQSHEQPAQSLTGLNFGVRPMSGVDVSGHVYYDFYLEEIYDVSVLPVVQIWKPLKVSLRYNRTDPSALIDKTSIFSVFANGQVQQIGGGADYDLRQNLNLQADYLFIDYDDYSAHEYSAGLIYKYGKKNRNRVSASVRRGDEDENGYIQPRLYLKQEIGKKLSFDADVIFSYYDEAIDDEDYSLSLGGDLGYSLHKNIKLVGAFDYTKSPVSQDEYRGILKMVYDFSGFVAE